MRGIWGLGEKKKWLSGLVHLLELGLSCCSAYQPQNLLLERRASGPLGKKSISSGQLFSGRHSLIPLLVVSYLFDILIQSGIESTSLAFLPSLGGAMGNTWVGWPLLWGGRILDTLLLCCSSSAGFSKKAHLLITFQGPYLVVSCFISGIHNCVFNRAGRKNMSIPFLWTRSLCLLYF